MNNNNNQFNNQSANNNFNTINEETMNYTTRLQNVLAQLEVEKSTNERLHAVLDNNKKLEATVTSNNKVIKESIEEFETLLDCYKEENKELQQQFDSEGDLSSVVESQEAALALIADIKKVLIPTEEKVTPSVVEETTSFWKEKPPARPVITEVAVTDEDFLRLTGKPRPTSQEEFQDALVFGTGLYEYTSCLSKEAQYNFWFKNQDIVCVYFWEGYTELEGLPTEVVQEPTFSDKINSLNNLFYNCSPDEE